MQFIGRVLNYAACMWAGVVVTTLMFALTTLIFFRHQDLDVLSIFLERLRPVVWIVGSLIGGLIAHRSERDRVQRL